MRLERQTMMETFYKRLDNLILSKKLPTIVQLDLSPDVVRVNTKGRCSTAVEAEGGIDFGSQCELYTLVDYVSPSELVAHEKCFEGSTLLHGECHPSHI